MEIKALKALTIRISESGDLLGSEDEAVGKLISIGYGAIAEVPEAVGQSLINDSLAEEYTTNVPTGTIEITNNGTVNVADYASAEVNVPGIIPTGTVSITENGTVDVTDYASASVNVPGPTGTISITENGTVDVTNYASAEVAVESGGDTTDLKNFVDRSITSVTANMLTGVTEIGNSAFKYCSHLTSLEIPNSVTIIWHGAFAGCGSLTSVSLPDGVVEIFDDVFSGCGSLRSVSLPASVGMFGFRVFQNCVSLTSVTVWATTPPDTPVSPDMFDNTPSNLVIYVPSESVNAYKRASGWSDYKNQIQAIPG